MKDDLSRGEHGQIISDRMSVWCSERTSEEALAEMEEVRLPAGPVLSLQQVLDDPHIKAKNLFQATDFPGLDRPVPLMRTPVELSETPGEIRHRAPQLGEHTDAILTEIGYNASEIAELRSKRIV